AFMALGADLPDPRHGDVVPGARCWAVEDLARANLAFDHGLVLAAAIERARAKLAYATLAAAFLPPAFTISRLRAVPERAWGRTPDAGNLHRTPTRTPGFLVDLERYAAPPGGRPARLYRKGHGSALVPPLLRSGD